MRIARRSINAPSSSRRSISRRCFSRFEELRSTGPFGGGFGEDVWRSQQVQEYGKAIAQNGGVGIADAVVRELIQAQEARS
jgi:hypothetical protein